MKGNKRYVYDVYCCMYVDGCSFIVGFCFFAGLDKFRLKQGSGCIQRCLNLEFGWEILLKAAEGWQRSCNDW